MRKNYSSLEEIQQDLRILEIKKDLHYHKLCQSLDNIKEEITPSNLVKSSLQSVGTYVKSSNTLQAFAITKILKYIFNRKK